ncbi:MaoC family dehydratase N-terminal domain-containing protein [Novosphingobium sp.]|uniref:FAS1-like dehydratase domain-containing protein n=1 Tax=Novosphingobium sp. TaxID=1874826 RepID=UPI0025D234A5|nr:MaoC family dehydratase N-terminal domain-containing protein [Novosphingobium sp.]
MSDWSAWIGREETRHDHVDPGQFARWCGTLDRVAPGDGNAAQGFHWCLGLPDGPTASLGPDGHPVRDANAATFLPPIQLPRRMWASSRVEFLAPVKVDEAVTRVSRILSVSEKTGQSGALAFVDVAHETSGSAGPCVREVQTIVYRAPAQASAPPSPPPPSEGLFDPSSWSVERVILPTEALLFRYSAITFNSHRIHYDLAYARDVEKYRGLVVHGPLMATLLLDLAGRKLGDNMLKTFTFRGVSPAICGEMLRLVLRSNHAALEFGIYSADGRQVMSASATT